MPPTRVERSQNCLKFRKSPSHTSGEGQQGRSLETAVSAHSGRIDGWYADPELSRLKGHWYKYCDQVVRYQQAGMKSLEKKYAESTIPIAGRSQ